MLFKCDFCQRVFKHKRSRDRHVRLHTGDKQYCCKHCKSAFSRSDHLKIHMRTHDYDKPYKCTECNRGYSSKAALTSHLQDHKKICETTSSPAFHCFLCSCSFSSANELQNHVERHPKHRIYSEVNPHYCVVCNLSCSSSDALLSHMEQSHGADTQNKCSVYLKSFHSSNQEATHKEIHKNGDNINFGVRSKIKLPVSDLECEFAFESNFSSLKAHTTSSHVTPRENFKAFPPFLRMSFLKKYQRQNLDGSFLCQHCPLKFSNFYKFQKHSIIDHSIYSSNILEEENISHYKRSMKFSNDDQLSKNFNTMHEGPFSKRESSENNAVNVFKIPSPSSEQLNDISVPLSSSVCSYCNAKFPDFEAFRLHLVSHINFATDTYKCCKCNSEFSTEEQLSNHIINHFLAVKIKYDCQCCLKLFSKPEELQKHLLEIHAVRLYWCSECKMMFDSKVSIQAHFSMQHSRKSVSLKCTSCSAIFYSKLDFQFHVKMTHLFRLQPECCLLCNQCFPSKELLEQHLNTHKKQYPCTVCGHTFLLKYLLDKHMQVCCSKNSVP